jgi:hypothetical protein
VSTGRSVGWIAGSRIPRQGDRATRSSSTAALRTAERVWYTRLTDRGASRWDHSLTHSWMSDGVSDPMDLSPSAGRMCTRSAESSRARDDGRFGRVRIEPSPGDGPKRLRRSAWIEPVAPTSTGSFVGLECLRLPSSPKGPRVGRTGCPASCYRTMGCASPEDCTAPKSCSRRDSPTSASR